MLAILDYKAGNQTSVARALDHLGIACRITARAGELENAAGIIFPGVGQAAQAMRQLQSTGLDQVLRNLVAMGKPLLGICLGCQIMLEESVEGPTQTLGILPGKCLRFADHMREEDGSPVKIPHMGWNGIRLMRQSRLFEGIAPDAQFYFVHSYYTAPAPELILALSRHGHDFCAAYGRDGLWCVQFHPEKSGRPGLALLDNFHKYCLEARHAV